MQPSLILPLLFLISSSIHFWSSASTSFPSGVYHGALYQIWSFFLSLARLPHLGPLLSNASSSKQDIKLTDQYHFLQEILFIKNFHSALFSSPPSSDSSQRPFQIQPFPSILCLSRHFPSSLILCPVMPELTSLLMLGSHLRNPTFSCILLKSYIFTK